MLLFPLWFCIGSGVVMGCVRGFGCVVVFYGFICCGCGLFRGCGYLVVVVFVLVVAGLFGLLVCMLFTCWLCCWLGCLCSFCCADDVGVGLRFGWL